MITQIALVAGLGVVALSYFQGTSVAARSVAAIILTMGMLVSAGGVIGAHRLAEEVAGTAVSTEWQSGARATAQIAQKYVNSLLIFSGAAVLSLVVCRAARSRSGVGDSK